MTKFSTLIIVASVLLIASSIGCRPTGKDIDENGAEELEGIVPVQLVDASFQHEVVESEMPVLVDMWAPWCQPCIEMKPIIRRLAKDLEGKVKVAELNIDQNAFIKAKYKIDRYPMLLIFDQGIEVKRLVGLQTIEELLAAIQSVLDSDFDLEKDVMSSQ